MASSSQRAENVPVSLVLPVGAVDARHGKRVPAFPEVRTNLLGFCLPHVHCGGLRIEAEEQDKLLVGLHELLHWWLSDAFVIRMMRLTVFQLWGQILKCAEGEGPERLAVPIHRRSPSGNRLAQLLDFVYRAHEATSPVQEIFAVSVSLHLAQTHGVISVDERNARRRSQKAAYRSIVNFTELYDPFEKVVERYGYAIAADIAFKSLCTHFPAGCCQAILSTVPTDGDWDGSFAFAVTDPRYRAMYEEVEAEIAFLTTDPAPGVSSFMAAYLTDTPFLPYLFCFDELGWHINRVVDLGVILGTFGLDKHVRADRRPLPLDGAIAIWFWFESMRQQLAAGVGLQCPFYSSDRPSDCCGASWPFFRELLEGLWRHTTGSGDWQPRGCLLR